MGRRYLAQDRRYVAGMDVLPLQAPVEAHYQQGRLTAGGQGSGFSQPLATGITHSPRGSRRL